MHPPAGKEDAPSESPAHARVDAVWSENDLSLFMQPPITLPDQGIQAT